MKKIMYVAAEKNLFAAVDGEIALAHIDGADPIVGKVVNCLSSDSYVLSTFHIELKDIPMPVIVMTRDNPLMQFEVISRDIDEFYAAGNRGACFNFYKALCEHQDWLFDTYLALHAAFFLDQRFPAGLTDKNIFEAAEYVNAVRSHFFSYVDAMRLQTGERE